MGLDMVELTLAIEDEFDIVISDAALEQMQTPQDFANYIGDEYLLKEINGCSSQRGFYKIRKLLMDEFSIKKEDIKHYTPLQELLQNDIRKKWKKLNKLLDNQLHYYLLSMSKEGNMTIFTLLVIFGSIILYSDENMDNVVGLLGLGFILYFFFSIILRPLFGKKIPYNMDVASLIKYVDESNSITKYTHPTSIIEKVIDLSAEQFGVGSSSISSHIKYSDLGA